METNPRAEQKERPKNDGERADREADFYRERLRKETREPCGGGFRVVRKGLSA